uniref:Uncharacterized protein n=1 Tax=Parascaris equorum TaxID=6256 RepID=A0A914R515_PAREQ
MSETAAVKHVNERKSLTFNFSSNFGRVRVQAWNVLIFPENKGSPELIQPSIYATDSEVLAKVQGQLLGAITLLDALQDGICFFITLFYLISLKQKMPAK